jgi:hypothetical protein
MAIYNKKLAGNLVLLFRLILARAVKEGKTNEWE